MMKRNYYFLFLLFHLFFSGYQITHAQAPAWLWAESMGGAGDDFGQSIAIDPSGNGNYFTTGYFQGTVDFDPGPGTANMTANGGVDIFITKSDAAGKLMWARKIGGTGNDFGRSLAMDPSGNLYITGYFQGTADFDPSDGIFNLSSAGSFDMFLAKLDNDGNFLWAKALGSTGSDFSRNMAMDSAGNGAFFITGSFSGTVDFDSGSGSVNLTSKGALDIFIAKFDSEGHLLWAKGMGGAGDDYAQSVALNPVGNKDVYIAGRFNQTVDFDPGPETYELDSNGATDIFVTKLDSNGHFFWAKAMGGTGTDVAWSMAIDPTGSGSVYTTGKFEGLVDFDPGFDTYNLISSGYIDIFISKLDSAGNFVWAKAIGGPEFDEANSIAIDPIAGEYLYITGYFDDTVDFDPGVDSFNLSSINGSDDAFIAKLDKNGSFKWAKSMGGNHIDNSYFITQDALGYVYVMGYFTSDSVAFDSFELPNETPYKYDVFVAKLDITISGTDHPEDHAMITIFPNPTNGMVHFDFGYQAGLEYNLTLTDEAGRVVISQKQIGQELDVSHLPPGLYFMKLQNRASFGRAKLLKQ